MSKENIQVHAPFDCWSDSLADSPDPVFRDRVLGDGLSLDPFEGLVRAPFDGEVLTIPDSLHAINLRALNGAEFLIHIGIDTVKLGGKGFEMLVSPGDRVVRGQELLRFDLDQVARQAPSMRTPILLLDSSEFEARIDRNAGPVNAGDLLFEVIALTQGSEPEQLDEGTEQLSRQLRCGLEHGIHARPAATLLAALKPFSAAVEIMAPDGRVARANSPVALMGLGLSRGDLIEIRATGTQAKAALDALEPLLAPMDSSSDEGTTEPALAPVKPVETPAPGSRLKGQAASPGLVMGVATTLITGSEMSYQSSNDPQTEQLALSSAIARLSEHLQALSASAESELAEIATAHHALLQDPGMLAQAEELIGKGHSAASAWASATDEAAASLASMSDRRMRERVDDIHDLGLQLQAVLAGQEPGQSQDLPEQAVLLADNLLPSQLMNLDQKKLAAICLAGGGATSHVAILAASLGVPMLVAAGDSVMGIQGGTPLFLDADQGELLVGPDPVMVERIERRMQREAELGERARREAARDCFTQDGERIHVMANLASVDEAKTAVAAGAEGCGLLRTEFLYMARPSAPTVDEQKTELQGICDALGQRTLIIRTLDAGADKPIAYLDQGPEENPALGVRGIRLSLAWPQLLEQQLEAIMSLSGDTPVNVMVPMITSLEEIDQVRTMMKHVGEKTGSQHLPSLGVMIETPAAALMAEQLAQQVDFFSIGTNDLTQYTLCMDRLEPRLASALDPLNPAVLSLIANTARAGGLAGIPVGVCGAAAGDLLAAPILLGLGVTELSMPHGLIARMKAHLRGVDSGECRKLAEQALAANSADAVRTLVRDWLSDLEDKDGA